MEYRRLGKSGMKVSNIAIGTHDFRDESFANQSIKESFDRGINFFDTSGSYGEKGEVEILTGKALKQIPRDEFVIATKVKFGYGAKGANNRGLGRKHMRHSVDISLKRLQVDFIDLFQLHGSDSETSIEETVQMLGDLIREGKILYWGMSNLNTTVALKYLKACSELNVPKPISHQPEYSLLQPGLVDSEGKYVGLNQLSEEYGFGIIPYSPLAGGMLTGKYIDGIPDDSRMTGNIWKGWQKKALTPERIEFVKKLKEISNSIDIEVGQLSLAWLLNKSFISSVITGFTKISQLESNISSTEIKLSTETVSKIDDLRNDFLNQI